MQNESYALEPQGENCATCDCCGKASKTIWGYIHDLNGEIVLYYWHWTVGSPQHDAKIELIIGPWGEDTEPSNRSLATIVFYVSEEGPAFHVIDSENSMDDLASHPLSREEIIATPLASYIFELIDFMWLNDERIFELHEW